MTTPYARSPGTKKYGAYEFEWLPLLKTPCYGFSGPNACYSKTCTHNPTLVTTGKQQIRLKYPISTKTPVRITFQPKKLMQPAPITFKTNEFVRDYGFSEPTYYPSVAQPNCCCYHKEPCFIDYVKELEGIQREPCYECTSYQYACDDFMCEDDGGSTKHLYHHHGTDTLVPPPRVIKKHIFNPLSKPFEPTQKNQLVNNCDCDAQSMDTIDSDQTNELTYEQEYSHACILCPERYRTYKELKRHIRDKVERPYNCIICKAVYKHEYLLKRHQNLHRALRQFTCRGCNKTFRSFLLLKKHFDDCRYKLYIFT